MMFYTDDRKESLMSAADLWVGTPFHDHAMRRGIGVDCVHLALGIYFDSGFDPDIVFPEYSMSEGQNGGEKLVNTLEASSNFQRIRSYYKREERFPGDLLCFKVSGRGSAHHVGVYLGTDNDAQELFINAMQRYGCRKLQLNRQWLLALDAVFRPLQNNELV